MAIFRRFAKAESGAAAVTFAIAVIPMMAAAGVAIDFGRYYAGQTQLQAALDDGTLAAALARDKSTIERQKIGADAFDANMKTGEISNTISTVKFVVGTSNVVASSRLTLPTTFMAAIGIESMELSAIAEVAIPENKNAEIAFVLDYSGSMGDVSGSEVKYIAMRKAATKLMLP